jgi:hypothetical protein
VPATTIRVPSAVEPFEGVDPRADPGVLMTHHAARFAAIVAHCRFVVVIAQARRAPAP